MAGERPQLVKSLPNKHKAPRLSPRTYIQKPDRGITVIPVMRREPTRYPTATHQNTDQRMWGGREGDPFSNKMHDS